MLSRLTLRIKNDLVRHEFDVKRGKEINVMSAVLFIARIVMVIGMIIT
jgi:hypothetical protein